MICKMLGTIEGLVQDKGIILIRLSDGFTYELQLTNFLFHEISKCNLPYTGSFWAHKIVRDDKDFLYGFNSAAERYVFIDLLTVPKVGPTTAFRIINLYGENTRRLIKENSLLPLSGVTEKTTEAIVKKLQKKYLKEDTCH